MRLAGPEKRTESKRLPIFKFKLSQARASMINSEPQLMRRSPYHSGHSDQLGRTKPLYHCFVCTERRPLSSLHSLRPRSTDKPHNLLDSYSPQPLRGSTSWSPNHHFSERSRNFFACSTKSITAGVAAAPKALTKHAIARPSIYFLRELPRAFLTSELNCFVDDMKKPFNFLGFLQQSIGDLLHYSYTKIH